MKANIDVTDRREADAIRMGLEDPEIRALVIVTGVLRALPVSVRRRVITMASERLTDNEPTEIQGNGGQAA